MVSFLLIRPSRCSPVAAGAAVALLCLTFSPNLAVGLRYVFRHVHAAVPVLQEAGGFWARGSNARVVSSERRWIYIRRESGQTPE